MKAELLIDRRLLVTATGFADLALWRVPRPVRGCTHAYKYRLVYVVNGVCVLRYDNEAGKGDHKHVDGVESPIAFTHPKQLMADFRDEIMRWNDENSHS